MPKKIDAKLIDDSPDYYDLPQKINNNGILYEARLHEKLKDFGLVPKGFEPAASDSNAPDIQFKWKNNSHNMEVKLNKAADFGQSGLIWHGNATTGKWILHGNSGPSHVAMRERLKSMDILKFVNGKEGWDTKNLGMPRRFKPDVIKNGPTAEDKRHDYLTFKDKTIPIPISAVKDYYKSKNIFYIHIGGLGTYHLGGDPAKMVWFTKMPELTGECKLRIRKKPVGSVSGGSTNYRFSLALLLKKAPNQSEFDITDDASIEILTSNQ